MECSALIFAVFILFTSTLSTNCFPAGERWKEPCGDQKELITEIITLLTDMEIFSNGTQTKYGKDRIKDQSFIDMYMANHLTGFQVLTATEEEQTTATEDIPSWHKKAYRQLSTAAIFLEQTVYNETKYSSEQQITGYAKEFEYLNNQTFTLLCKVQAALAQKGQVVEDIPSRDIMSDRYRHISLSSHMFARDFIISKDIYLTVKNLLMVYKSVQSAII